MYPKSDQSTKSLGVFLICKPINLLASMVSLFPLFIVLVACNPTANIENSSATNNETRLHNDTITGVSSSEVAFETSTPTPISSTETRTPTAPTEPTTRPTKTPQLVVETKASSLTVTPTILPKVKPISCTLFVADPDGIQQVMLEDGSAGYLLTKEEDWLDWGARFAQNEKYLAYWVKRDNYTELWITSLFDWQTESILQVDEVLYDFATPFWVVNDRYLLFILSVLDNSGPLEETKTIRTYIFDMEAREMVHPPYWPGECSLLATSPQTSQLALWCFKEETTSPDFLVLEPVSMPWITQQTPEPYIDDCFVRTTCAWSKDNELVVFVNSETYPESLLYTQVTNPLPIMLDDGQTKVYGFPEWSPNSQLLYYSGACGDGTIQCPNVMSISNQEVDWRALNNYNQGEFGVIDIHNAAWSPDSLYLAIPITGHGTDTFQQLLIFDFMSQTEVARLPYPGTIILDLIWVGNE